MNEKKVDHLTIGLELYTRSYELFKKWSPQNGQQGQLAQNQNQNPGRLTLWIAYRIAQTYYDSAKFDMAVRYVLLLFGLIVDVQVRAYTYRLSPNESFLIV